MKSIVHALDSIVQEYSLHMMEIPSAEFSAKPHPEKWSKKEIVGHLIDSGQNNLRRFICGQYDVTPPTIVYEQDFWVAANGYQQYEKKDIILLWKLINAQISSVLSNMTPENHSKTARTNKDSDEEKTLEWLAADYTKHMKHHLNKIFDNVFPITYP